MLMNNMFFKKCFKKKATMSPYFRFMDETPE